MSKTAASRLPAPAAIIFFIYFGDTAQAPAMATVAAADTNEIQRFFLRFRTALKPL